MVRTLITIWVQLKNFQHFQLNFHFYFKNILLDINKIFLIRISYISYECFQADWPHMASQGRWSALIMPNEHDMSVHEPQEVMFRSWHVSINVMWPSWKETKSQCIYTRSMAWLKICQRKLELLEFPSFECRVKLKDKHEYLNGRDIIDVLKRYKIQNFI